MTSCCAGLRTAALGVLAALGLSWGAATRAQDTPACPPQAQALSAQQMHAAAPAARDRGLLWRIARDGRSSYLYGTIHVGKPDWMLPGPQVRSALLASDLVAFEIDPLDAAMQAALRLAAPAAGPALPAAMARRLQALRGRACVPPQTIEALHPLLQAVTLAVLEVRRQGLHVAFGQELALSGLAHANQRRVASLETPESQMASLIPRDTAVAERALAQLLEQIESGATARVVARMAAAWERGDLAELADYERWCECVASDEGRAWMRQLNDERNPALAERIDALHREGRQVFAAVGALHMTGAKALPALLRERGFTVQRVPLQTLQ